MLLLYLTLKKKTTAMNYIGLDKAKMDVLALKMNQLLSTYQVHYQNLRSLHWNIAGENFFELHVKYEELYTRTQAIIDEIAERILTLNSSPYHTFSEYLKSTALEELASISNGRKGMEYLLSSQKELLILEREILTFANEAEDEGTASFMSDLIREKEKSSWMFKAWLNK